MGCVDGKGDLLLAESFALPENLDFLHICMLQVCVYILYVVIYGRKKNLLLCDIVFLARIALPTYSQTFIGSLLSHYLLSPRAMELFFTDHETRLVFELQEYYKISCIFKFIVPYSVESFNYLL